MRFKYCFVLAAILIILFSLGTVVANENVTQESSIDDAYSTNDENQDVLDTGASSDGETDVSVRLDVENAYDGDKFNQAGSEVPWTVTVQVSRGIAKNTKVYETLSENMEYVSHNLTVGTYAPETGIWDIGDLDSSNNATLTILTKLTSNGRFKNTVNVTTDSNDIDLSNNVCNLAIRSGTGKSTGNITQTTDDANQPQHDDHQGSEAAGGFLQRESEESSPDGSNSKAKDAGTKSNSNKKSDSSPGAKASNEDKPDSVAKSTMPVAKTISNDVSSSIDNVLNPDSNSSEDNPKDDAVNNNHVGAIYAFDYAKIPIFICLLFLVALCAIVGYNKFKS
jgi:hypothetical protein